MEIAFNWESGNWPKCGKHGVSREEIELLFAEGKIRIAPDLAHTTTKESRHIAAAWVNKRALFVVFTMRGSLIRPISARYMHAKEEKFYTAVNPARFEKLM